MTTILRAAARALTGTSYAILGFDAWRAPGLRVDMAAPMLAAVRKVAPVPGDDELLVRANGAAQAAAGAALAVGVAPRLNAAVLVASLVPTTLAGHSFWAVEDPVARKQQLVQFLKNAAMLGGLLFAVIDNPPPRPDPGQ